MLVLVLPGVGIFSNSSWYEDMFWIWAENSVDSIDVLLLLLSSAESELKPSGTHTTLTTGEEAAGSQGAGEGTQPGQLTQGIFHIRLHHAQHIQLGEEGKKGKYFKWWHYSSQNTVTCDRVLLSWRWLKPCSPACPWEEVNDDLVLLSLCEQLLLHHLNCFYLYHRFSSFYSSNSFPHPIVGGLRECM